jgi:predicted dienelactone hydrolase
MRGLWGNGLARVHASVASALALGLACSACARVDHLEVPEQPVALGVTSLVVVDGARGRTIDTVLFYPAHGREVPEPHVFIYALEVARDAPVAGALRRPLVVLSHGTGGTPYDMAWLARALVDAGHIVVAPAHPGDTFGDSSVLRALETWQRPRDVTAVLDALLTHREWRRRIDSTRIAIVGHSAGGYTALASVGATYSIANAEKKCRVAVGDPTCDLVKPVDRSSIDYSKSAVNYADKRIRAAIALAPAVGEAADEKTARAVARPVLIVGAKHDQLALFDGHARHWASLLPTSTLLTLDEGDHYLFVGPCMPHGALVADACRDPAGFDRKGAQKDIATRVVAFLLEAFASHETHSKRPALTPPV